MPGQLETVIGAFQGAIRGEGAGGIPLRRPSTRFVTGFAHDLCRITPPSCQGARTVTQ